MPHFHDPVYKKPGAAYAGSQGDGTFERIQGTLKVDHAHLSNRLLEIAKQAKSSNLLIWKGSIFQERVRMACLVNISAAMI